MWETFVLIAKAIAVCAIIAMVYNEIRNRVGKRE